MTKEEVEELAEGAILLDGFDDCITGVVEEFGNGVRILYSRDKILESLQKDMSYEDALEYYYYNIVGGHFGERNPLDALSIL
jgi:hypothetical protein